jgi:hypothetical protein
MNISSVRSQLNSLANRVYRKETRIVVETSGIAVAGLVSAEDLLRLERLDRDRAARFGIIDDMRAAFADVSAEDIEEAGARSLAEVRAARDASGAT